MKTFIAVLVTGLVTACVVFLVFLLLIRVLWAWTVPDLFPGAVAQGLVAPTISWFAAAKVALIIAILSGIVARKR